MKDTAVKIFSWLLEVAFILFILVLFTQPIWVSFVSKNTLSNIVEFIFCFWLFSGASVLLYFTITKWIKNDI